MATLSGAMRHVKQHLDQLLPEQLVLQLCRDLKHRWRNRVLGPAVTVQLLLLQLLAGVAMTGLRHVSGLSVTAQAICAARMRLPLKLMMELVRRSAASQAVEATWKGLRVYLADGMSFMTQDTAALAEQYGKAKNHKGAGYGYPNPKLLALMDLEGGFIQKVITLPWHRQEFTCLSRLFKAIGASALMLGDRGLVSFTHLAMLMGQGIQGCFRLPRGQAVFGRGRTSRRKIKPLGRQDLLVRWRASQRPKWLSKKRWAALAKQELVLRQIAFRVRRRGFRTQWAWIVTTLTDPKAYPAQDLIDLYGKRWQIEVYFRDLKRTLDMSLISARTPEGARKEILAFVLLYNLIRGVMKEAARRQGTEPERISFVDALRWLLWSEPGAALADLVVNPIRVRNAPPRRVKVARHRFPQLNAPRQQLCKPPCQAML
jgi:Transposase DDE domain